MECKDKISYIIFGYLNEEYEINDFCNLYLEYYEELDTENLYLPVIWRLRTLCEMCGRFSDFPEDLEMYPGVYYTEKEIKEYMETFPLNIWE